MLLFHQESINQNMNMITQLRQRQSWFGKPNPQEDCLPILERTPSSFQMSQQPKTGVWNKQLSRSVTITT